MQESGITFHSVDDLLKALNPNFVAMKKVTIADYLMKLGYSELFIKELVTGAMRSNYGQSTDLHAFVGNVSTVDLQHT